MSPDEIQRLAKSVEALEARMEETRRQNAREHKMTADQIGEIRESNRKLYDVIVSLMGLMERMMTQGNARGQHQSDQDRRMNWVLLVSGLVLMLSAVESENVRSLLRMVGLGQ